MTMPPEEITPTATCKILPTTADDLFPIYVLDNWPNVIPTGATGRVVDVVYHYGSRHTDHAGAIDWSKVRSFKVVGDVEQVPENAKKYSHYFKRIPWKHIDIYRLLEVFGVTDNAIGHALKKLLVPGLRGNKPTKQDVIEARDTLNRRIEMWEEDEALALSGPDDML